MAKLINTDNIEDGMVIAKDVLNNNGFVIVPAGMKVTDRHKRVLKTWNVSQVYVVDGESDDNPPIITTEIRELCIQSIKQKVRWLPELDIEHDLIESIIHRLSSLYVRRNEE